ncbi:hypothetical protein CNO14_06865 (plasmid) [Borrelia miyamotoi]|uniref:Uncharacterized protein n=2 Tax=Borrelia miyamotoi TaxID=47466 RepID=A0ABY7VP02_9SPIR|nr:hypothetical protein [Borrelia miyamotoi]AHH05590.1 Hypothetical protein BOM_1047 [Borrelia miyamotoi FR64b]WAZ71043.1 hypothetical protein O5403_05145 [Borrelia miyamotoi]WCB91030.1 hypothetical protein CNO11_07250 [Borrelia miyamotoi]WCL22159.1 hypothetical protein CNO10_07285 [Borrelia miyamotoi]WDE70387.1 hypothetical protein CNO12_07310 [Borrelia miyamotoi]
MIVNVNLSGRIELPYIPDYMRKQGSDVESEDRAFIILEGIDYGFIEGVKAFQIELLQKLTLLNSSTSKEVDPRVALDVTNQQMEFVKKFGEIML